CQASCGGSPWFPVREVGPGNPILSDSTGEPPPSTFNYAWDIAGYSEAMWSARLKALEDAAAYHELSVRDNEKDRAWAERLATQFEQRPE
ncbi:hypothetical protein, partial [Burkholderia contaminans]|uniref:hypothetical protein n=1 Tax=Burkholderia contaminans TaxID=488447 RepID=UPI001C95009E